MAGQDDRTGRSLREERRDVGGVSCHPVEEVGRSEDREALPLEFGRYGVPARSVCPCSVNQDDRRLRHVAPLRSAGSTSSRAIYSRPVIRLTPKACVQPRTAPPNTIRPVAAEAATACNPPR